MRKTTFFTSGAALALVLPSLMLAAPAGGPVGSQCLTGFAKGTWELPDTAAGGFLSGELLRGTTSTAFYALTGTLNDVQPPCMSCREGVIDAVLDVGIGPGPDFLVKGTYFGGFLSGTGTFSAQILEPIDSGLVPVGRILGTYSDPPGPLAVLGTFVGRWGICP